MNIRRTDDVQLGLKMRERVINMSLLLVLLEFYHFYICYIKHEAPQLFNEKEK